MATILRDNPVLLSHLINDPVFFARNISERKVWKDKQPTDEIAGYLYDCCNTQTYQNISVFVAGKKPVIPLKEFEMMRDSNQQLFVEFENATLSVYLNFKTNSIEDKVVADDVHVVEVEA